jgi:hypothetical protein
MRRKVRELIRDGADVLKVAVSGGVLSPRDDPRHAHFRMQELETLVEEAAAAGRWVMAHAQSNEGIKQAVRAGIRSIDHGLFLDEEALSLMTERGTWLVPTLVAPQGIIDAAEAGAMSHLRIAGGIHQPGNSLRVPDQPNGARGKPLVRATIGISAPFRPDPRIRTGRCVMDQRKRTLQAGPIDGGDFEPTRRVADQNPFPDSDTYIQQSSSASP